MELISRHVKVNRKRKIRYILSALSVGIISTTSMTLVMERLYHALPRDEQYPLPPEEITVVAESKVFGNLLDDPQHMAFTLLNHFGYGTLLGTAYSLIAERIPLAPLVKGVSYGAFVWIFGYLGWLPSFHVLRSATEFPLARRSLLIISHLVWGALLGVLSNHLPQER
jgi:hypothetical protein